MNPDKICLNCQQICLNREQISFDRDRISSDRKQITLNLRRISFNPEDIVFGPGNSGRNPLYNRSPTAFPRQASLWAPCREESPPCTNVDEVWPLRLPIANERGDPQPAVSYACGELVEWSNRLPSLTPRANDASNPQPGSTASRPGRLSALRRAQKNPASEAANLNPRQGRGALFAARAPPTAFRADRRCGE